MSQSSAVQTHCIANSQLPPARPGGPCVTPTDISHGPDAVTTQPHLLPTRRPKRVNGRRRRYTVSVPVYLLTGPFSEFHGLTFKHHLALERELDQTDPLSEHGAQAYELRDVR